MIDLKYKLAGTDLCSDVDQNSEYLHFASNVSFYDFASGLPEFKKLKPRPDLEEITRKLQEGIPWTFESLSQLVKTRPNVFEVIARIFQQERFSDAQLTHFAFAVEKLNSKDEDVRYDYAIEELKRDQHCQDLFAEQIRPLTISLFDIGDVLNRSPNFSKEMVSALFKVVVCTCIHEMSGKDTLSSHLSKRLSDPATGSADRFAKYTLETLQLNQLLESIDAGKFVERKLIPTDTKGRHGNFEQDRVEQVFEEGGFDNLEEHVSKEQLGATLPITLDVRGMGLDPSKKYYCKQKYVVGIKKRKDGRPKKFDFVILVDGKPRHLFEVNFYSTTGTKIGINKDEYRLMNSLIKEGLNSKFHWITDGNYWLTQGGMADLDELRKELDIYNINTLRENLHRFVT